MRYQIGGFSNVLSSVGKNNFSSINPTQVGRVYGVVTTANTPNKEQFERVGGYDAMGTIFYRDYNQAQDTVGEINNNFFNDCKVAKPLFPQFQYYPVLGELVVLYDLPSPATQISPSSTETYYLILNLWNNNQQNSQPANDNASLGTTFVENPDIRNLVSFQGDHIIQGRQGAALRFGSTTKLYNDLNEWSSVGAEDSPITILTNGFNYISDAKVYVEKINHDSSSIYLTSTQQLPLQTDKTGTLNPLTNPLDAADYFNSQIILNADRVTLNSRKDEIMMFAKTNVEINTNNIINLNANERVHLNTNTVFLGTVNNQLPTEPIVLGNRLYDLLEGLLDGLQTFSIALTTVVASPEGAPMIDLNNAAQALSNKLENVEGRIENILSNRNFTA
jgi:hypothetical protein